ncbi:MAG: hypothetical protein AAGA58_06505 [Verrucomicrobiota bacterium]
MIANEIVALKFAQYLHLPVPPGGVVMNRAGTQPRFFSLELFPDGTKPIPPVNPQELVTKFSDLCWGITLFDAFLINKDRKPGNLAYDEKLDALHIFDHGNCLFGMPGRKKMNKHREIIGTGDHCLEKSLKKAASYKKWVSAIADIPDQFIENAAFQGQDVGYTKGDCEFVRDRLIERKTKIHNFVLAQIDKFAALPEGERKKIREANF